MIMLYWDVYYNKRGAAYVSKKKLFYKIGKTYLFIILGYRDKDDNTKNTTVKIFAFLLCCMIHKILLIILMKSLKLYFFIFKRI